jgi:hypothetical protein
VFVIEHVNLILFKKYSGDFDDRSETHFLRIVRFSFRFNFEKENRKWPRGCLKDFDGICSIEMYVGVGFIFHDENLI